LGHLQKFIQYIIVELSPPLFSFIPLSHSWNSFNWYNFLHLHICVYNIWTIFTLPPPFPATAPPHPVLRLCRRKQMIFLLVWDKGSYTGNFLVIFLCIITPNSLSPLIFFTLKMVLNIFLFLLSTVAHCWNTLYSKC
jgi:hypothetical protein